MDFVFSKSFRDRFERLDQSVQLMIHQKLVWLETLENPMLQAKKLKGYKDIYRFRSGDYRIVFRRSSQQIILLELDHRKHIYQAL